MQAPDWPGPSYQTCKDAAVVARHFPPAKRSGATTFQHHREVAALPREQAEAILERAASEGLSTRALRAEVGKLRNATAVGAPPEPIRSGQCYPTISAIRTSSIPIAPRKPASMHQSRILKRPGRSMSSCMANE